MQIRAAEEGDAKVIAEIYNGTTAPWILLTASSG